MSVGRLSIAINWTADETRVLPHTVKWHHLTSPGFSEVIPTWRGRGGVVRVGVSGLRHRCLPGLRTGLLHRGLEMDTGGGQEH